MSDTPPKIHNGKFENFPITLKIFHFRNFEKINAIKAILRNEHVEFQLRNEGLI